MEIIKSNRELTHLTPEELKALISSLAMDIEFYYGNSRGAICPINAKHIDICFGDYNAPNDRTDLECHSVDEVMTVKFIKGHSLMELCDKILFDI